MGSVDRIIITITGKSYDIYSLLFFKFYVDKNLGMLIKQQINLCYSIVRCYGNINKTAKPCSHKGTGFRKNNLLN